MDRDVRRMDGDRAAAELARQREAELEQRTYARQRIPPAREVLRSGMDEQDREVVELPGRAERVGIGEQDGEDEKDDGVGRAQFVGCTRR